MILEICGLHILDPLEVEELISNNLLHKHIRLNAIPLSEDAQYNEMIIHRIIRDKKFPKVVKIVGLALRSKKKHKSNYNFLKPLFYNPYDLLVAIVYDKFKDKLNEFNITSKENVLKMKKLVDDLVWIYDNYVKEVYDEYYYMFFYDWRGVGVSYFLALNYLLKKGEKLSKVIQPLLKKEFYNSNVIRFIKKVAELNKLLAYSDISDKIMSIPHKPKFRGVLIKHNLFYNPFILLKSKSKIPIIDGKLLGYDTIKEKVYVNDTFIRMIPIKKADLMKLKIASLLVQYFIPQWNTNSRARLYDLYIAHWKSDTVDRRNYFTFPSYIDDIDFFAYLYQVYSLIKLFTKDSFKFYNTFCYNLKSLYKALIKTYELYNKMKIYDLYPILDQIIVLAGYLYSKYPRLINFSINFGLPSTVKPTYKITCELIHKALNHARIQKEDLQKFLDYFFENYKYADKIITTLRTILFSNKFKKLVTIIKTLGMPVIKENEETIENCCYPRMKYFNMSTLLAALHGKIGISDKVIRTKETIVELEKIFHDYIKENLKMYEKIFLTENGYKKTNLIVSLLLKASSVIGEISPTDRYTVDKLLLASKKHLRKYNLWDSDEIKTIGNVINFAIENKEKFDELIRKMYKKDNQV